MNDADFITQLNISPKEKEELLRRFTIKRSREKLFSTGMQLFTQIGEEQKFREIIEEIREVIWIFDWKKQKVSYVSPAFEEIWQIPPGSLYENYFLWEKSIHPEDVKYTSEFFENIINTGGGEIREYRIIRPDETIRWISDRGFAIRDKSGEIKTIVGIAEDITDQKHAKDALKASEENYRVLVESPSVVIFRASVNGKYIFINDAFSQILGYSQDEIFSIIGFNNIHSDDLKNLKEKMRPLYQGHTVNNVPYRYKKKNGNYAHLITNFAPIMNSKGIMIEFIGICRDVTEQRIAEAEKRKSEIKFSSVLQNSEDFIHILDLDGTILKTNRAAMEGLGYTREEMEGHKIADFFSQETEPIFQDNFAKLQQVGRSTAEIKFVHKSGRIMLIECRGSAIYGDNGNITAFVSFQRDITEQKKYIRALQDSQTELRESEELFSTFMDNFPGQIVLRDLAGNYQYMNKYAEKLLFGQDWRKKTFHELFDPAIVKEIVEDDLVILEQGIVDMEDTVLNEDGSKRNVRSIKFRIDHPDKEPLIGLISLDISEKKKYEQEIIKIQKLESLGLLAGGIAHDFNNILTSILGNLSLLKFDVDPESEEYDSLNEVEKATYRAKDLTNQLLTFSKGGAPIKKTSNIIEVIQESANFVLHGSNVKCQYDFDGDFAPVELDKGQINQVINNLVINAEQAMPSGGILQIKASAFVQDRDSKLPLRVGNYILISIHDNGSGIPMESQSQIFDPFFTTKPNGSGLGLATSFSIIKRHGGILTFESTPNEGTTFFIYLPSSKTQIKAQKKAQGKELPQYAHRILIMDDEEAILLTVSKMLKKLQCQCYSTRDGLEAISVFGEEFSVGSRFDAIILDLTIPGSFGGYETLQKIREIDPSIFAIVSSGYSTDPIMAEYQDYGFDYAIPKPFTIGDLKVAISKISNKQM